ncbi:MAG TPA: hypothetical protein PLL01_06295 [Rhodoferax sp.]|jgi:hypothetical protein|nr:hypothetical protein [Rhodoferax sp.]HPW28983.1 hypothetical protein [Rhodoferax sp.]
MRRNFVKAMTTATSLIWLFSASVLAQSPKREKDREVARDLTVELRQVKDGDEGDPSVPAGAYTAGTTSREADFAPQQVRVRCGEKASLQINQSMPLQWVQKIESQSATLSAASASASATAGGVTQAVTWMESGQSFSVTPHWTGGKQAVKLEIEVQSSAVDERTSSDLPATTRQRYSTTVSAPLHQWVTIASSGRSPQPGRYSSAVSSDARRLIQVRVSTD